MSNEETAFDDTPMKIRKQVPQGSVLLKEKPFVYVLSSKVRTEYCDHCFNNNKGVLLKCSGCRYVYYCGKVCQRDAWSLHKLECKNLQRISPRILPDGARFMARLLWILNRGGDLVKSYYIDNTSFRMYKDLMSRLKFTHTDYPNVKLDQRRMEHFTSLCGVLFDFLGDHLLPNSAELMGMYGRMCINSFNIMSQDMQCLGTGMYLGASVIDHSCSPNAVAIFEGTTLYIRALVTFSYLDWARIHISYIDVLNSTDDRREELEAGYYFSCSCVRCLSDEPIESRAMACPNASCPGFVDPDSGDRCCSESCGAEVGPGFVGEFREVMDFTNLQLQNMKQLAYLDVCEICLKRQEGVLYKYNLRRVKILDLAFQSSIDFQKWDSARRYGLELVDAYYEYYGLMHPLTGLLHLKLGKIMLLLDEKSSSQALHHLKKAYDVLKVTHGVGSQLFRQELGPLLQQANASSK